MDAVASFVSTGDRAHERLRSVVVPYDRFEIVVLVKTNNEFAGIREVRVNKDFLSYRQRLLTHGVIDVEEYDVE